jgi:hypothetical protein
MSLMGQGTVSDVGLEPHSDRYSGIALPPDARAPLGGFQTVNQPRFPGAHPKTRPEPEKLAVVVIKAVRQGNAQGLTVVALNSR